MNVTSTQYQRMTRQERAKVIETLWPQPFCVGAYDGCSDGIWSEKFNNAYESEKRAIVSLLLSLNLDAGQVAEAILLREPLAWWGESGEDETIDRAMRMARQWDDDGYADCFTCVDVKITAAGRVCDMRQTCLGLGSDEQAARAISAGAIAAQVAEYALTFKVFTEAGCDQPVVAAT